MRRGTPITTCWPAWRPRQANDLRLLALGSAARTPSGVARLSLAVLAAALALAGGLAAKRASRDLGPG